MTFLELLQSIYGNTSFSVADVQLLAERFGLDAETALLAGRTADGPIRTQKRNARWACFHHPNY